MQWHMWVNGSADKVIYEDQETLNDFLNTMAAGTIVTVRRFDMIERETSVYGVTGGNAIPPKPSRAIKAAEKLLKHVTMIF